MQSNANIGHPHPIPRTQPPPTQQSPTSSTPKAHCWPSGNGEWVGLTLLLSAHPQTFLQGPLAWLAPFLSILALPSRSGQGPTPPFFNPPLILKDEVGCQNKQARFIPSIQHGLP